MEKHDVIVVGSGTAGYTVAKDCAKAGKSVAVVEQGTLGGTCALHGCQPKKFFVVQAEMAKMAQDLEGKGVTAPPSLDWSHIAAFKREFTDAVPGNTEAFFSKIGATLYQGKARFTASDSLQVGDVGIQAEAIVLATGARPRILTIPGGNLALNSDDFLAMKELPKSLIFIGGGYISFEFAHIAAAMGSRVTVLNKSDRVLKQFDSELVDATVQASVHAGIEVRTGQEPVELTETTAGFQVRCKSGDTFNAAAVFVAAGRLANLDEMNLELLGLSSDPRGLIVNSQMLVDGQTRLYAVGDCARTMALAPVADREALVAAANISGKTLHMDYRIVPSVCFTQPPMGAVGLTEKEALDQGLSFTVRKGMTTAWPNQRRLGAKHGRFKLLVDDAGKLLGAHILGHEAGDITNLFALAMKGDIPVEVFKEMMWAYPTLTSDTKYMV